MFNVVTTAGIENGAAFGVVHRDIVVLGAIDLGALAGLDRRR
jgi:hypothetical protein